MVLLNSVGVSAKRGDSGGVTAELVQAIANIKEQVVSKPGNHEEGVRCGL